VLLVSWAAKVQSVALLLRSYPFEWVFAGAQRMNCAAYFPAAENAAGKQMQRLVEAAGLSSRPWSSLE